MVPKRCGEDYAKGGFYDQEGDAYPSAASVCRSEDGRRWCPSGTEPKIKYYLFGKGTAREEVQASLDALWGALKADADERVGP